MKTLIELLKKLGAKDEDITAVEAEIEADKEAEVAGLKKKNNELIAKAKAARDGDGGKVAELQDKIDELSEQIAAAKRDGDKAVKALTKERDELKTLADGEKTAVTKLLLDNGLTEALTKAGVKKELLPAARAYLKEQGVLSIKSEGDVRKAVAKLAKDGKEAEVSLDDYVVHFATTDEGKAFIPAGSNSGGGAGGSGGSGGGGNKTMSRAQFAALDAPAKTEFAKSGGKLTD